MQERTAHCACGRLSATVSGDPVRVSVCHCRDCQRRTGSVFGVQARFPEEQVAITGDTQCYQRVADSGQEVQFHFCPNCGSTVYYRLLALPGFIAIPVGVFADQTFPQPSFSVYEVRKHPWVVMPERCEHLE